MILMILGDLGIVLRFLKKKLCVKGRVDVCFEELKFVCICILVV